MQGKLAARPPGILPVLPMASPPLPADTHTIYTDQGPVSERRLSENSEYVNSEMRETLGFPFQNGRFVKPGKAG